MTLMAPLLAPAGSKALRHGLRFATAEPARGISKARRRWLALGGVALLGCAGYGALASHGSSALISSASPEAAAPARPAAAQRPATPAWVEVVRPFMAYDLAGGPFARLPLRYEARRSVAGDVREDTLAYGDARPGAPFLRLAFTRQGLEPQAATSLFVDAARLAAAAGLAVTRSGLGFRLDTRFGPFEVAGVRLSEATPSGDARPGDCLALRLDAPATLAVLRLVGLACGGAAPLTPEALACTIDKLDLVSAGDDEALRAVFVAAERRRGDTCTALRSTDLHLAPAGAPQESRALLKSTL